MERGAGQLHICMMAAVKCNNHAGCSFFPTLIYFLIAMREAFKEVHFIMMYLDEGKLPCGAEKRTYLNKHDPNFLFWLAISQSILNRSIPNYEDIKLSLVLGARFTAIGQGYGLIFSFRPPGQVHLSCAIWYMVCKGFTFPWSFNILHNNKVH